MPFRGLTRAIIGRSPKGGRRHCQVAQVVGSRRSVPRNLVYVQLLMRRVVGTEKAAIYLGVPPQIHQR